MPAPRRGEGAGYFSISNTLATAIGPVIAVLLPCAATSGARPVPQAHKWRARFTDDLDPNDGESSSVVALPYWSWQAKLASAAQILSAQAKDPDNTYEWPLIKDKIALCDVAFSPSEVEIGLPAPYLDAIPSFVEANSPDIHDRHPR